MSTTVFVTRVWQRKAALVALAMVVLPYLTLSAVADTDRAAVEAIIAEYLSKNPDVVRAIVRDYLRSNPEIVQQALGEIIRRNMPPAKPAADQAAAIKAQSAMLLNSPRQVVLGNPQGDVTLVEFFDYNCGFCKKAYLDKFELMRTDGRLRVVLKELPILGPGSVEAAQVAVAVRMQDPGGEKYVAFHRAMMGAAGQANKASALAAARGAGLDMDRLERDLANPETKASIDESRMLANSLGITATPSFVVGDSVTTGAAGISKLAEKIAAARR